MPFRYTVKQNTPDSHNVSAWWFAVVSRFSKLDTLDHSLVTFPGHTELNVSKTDADLDPVAELPPLILANRIVGWSVTHSKPSHLASAAFQCAPGSDLARLVHAGDWIMFWAFDNKYDYDRILGDVRRIISLGIKGLGANDFFSGLKFVGRVNAPRERTAVDPETGRLSIMYQLTGVGFQEFDSAVYFNQAHVAKYADVTAGYVNQVTDVQTKIDGVVADVLPISVKDHTMLWLETFLGAGPGDSSKGYSAELAHDSFFGQDIKSGLQQTPNDIFLVPRSVAMLLGIETIFEKPRYVDLLSIFIGVQGASSNARDDRFTEDRRESVIGQSAVQAGQGFALESIADPSGMFRPEAQNFNNVPVWSVLERFSNRPINEMFTCLRVNANNQITPTFVLRQSPYTSRRGAEAFTNFGLPTTPFTDLPRWVIDSTMVQSADVGASDSMRVNYCSVQGIDPVGDQHLDQAIIDSVVAPPMADMADIKRSGLRPMLATVNSCARDLDDTLQRGQFYTSMLADMSLDGHLKWSGTVSMRGVQEPICPGDNAEWRNIIYHIESVVHRGSIDANTGRKTFTTDLSLSNGVSVISDTEFDTVYPHEQHVPDKLRLLGLPTYEPAVTVERSATDPEGTIEASTELAAERAGALAQDRLDTIKTFVKTNNVHASPNGPPVDDLDSLG